MKQRIVFLRGCPASGKSTWAKNFMAKNTGYKRLNKDLMRTMFDFGVWNKKNENFIKNMEEVLIREILSAGFNVLWDNTHLLDRDLERAERIAEEYDCDLEIKEFNTPVQECIERDSKRENPVGEKIIRGMHNRNCKRPKEVEFIEGLPDAVICDIDGCLAFKGDRDIFDYSKVYLDTVNPLIQRFINLLPDDVKVIFCSGRDDSCKLETMEWIDDNVIIRNDWNLLMRETGDKRADDIIKEEIYHEHIEGRYNVNFWLDDRLRVRTMVYRLGLPLLSIGCPECDF